MRQLQALLRATTKDEVAAQREGALHELRGIFPEAVWGIHYEPVYYKPANRKSVWDYGVPAAAKQLLESQGVTLERYSRWLGDVHFHAISVYPKSLFDKYRENAGWRISVFSVPRVEATLAGLASHYQNAQNQDKLAAASALLRSAAEGAIARAESVTSIPGRRVAKEDWNGTDLMSAPLLSVDGCDISAVLTGGLDVKCARTSTVKRAIASFITVAPRFADLSPADAQSELEKLRDAGRFLVEDVYPFRTLEEFEPFRSAAYIDPNDAAVRLRMKAGSAIKSVVRVYVGPPGTGKTLTAVKEAVRLVEPTFSGDFASAFLRFNELHNACCLVTFHPSLQYHDLVESIRPTLLSGQIDAGTLPEKVEDDDEADDETGNDNVQLDSNAALNSTGLSYTVFEGPLLRMIRRAQADPNGNFVVVIDEINRGDLSRILGPLISCLETDKRAGAEYPIGYELQYPKGGERDGRLYLPSNLHILGTMNSTDRNVALVDYALRRRFDFVEVPPEPDLLGVTEDEEPIDCVRLLEVLNQRVSFLLDDHHRLGHGFLMGCKTNLDVFARLAKKVIPQLREYFFGNEGMLLLVFGEAESTPYRLFNTLEANSFEATFGVRRDVAAAHGYRGTSASARLQLDPRFWDETGVQPGPGDELYATKAVAKIYAPAVAAAPAASVV